MAGTSKPSVADYFAAHQKAVSDSLGTLSPAIESSSEAIVAAVVASRKVIAFGNGGSATQASHLAGELLGRFRENRRPLPAIALGSDPGVVTCIANDFGYDAVFDRQVEALAEPGDIAIGLSTSGKSQNVIRGLVAAKRCGAVTIALTGSIGLAGGIKADHLLAVRSATTAHVQELHLMVLHLWCMAIDAAVIPGESPARPRRS